MKSPKCPACLEQNKIAQTMHVARSPFFKCRDCKRLFHTETFNQIEFMWHESPKAWRKYQISKGLVVAKGKPVDHMQTLDKRKRTKNG